MAFGICHNFIYRGKMDQKKVDIKTIIYDWKNIFKDRVRKCKHEERIGIFRAAS